ncbi:hypothetical protein HZC09_03550 [Candidatus Micrarchaeota archaeon]|nr:hypothetical protein [Candidatus Micrarchaeota archaeon]
MIEYIHDPLSGEETRPYNVYSFEEKSGKGSAHFTLPFYKMRRKLERELRRIASKHSENLKEALKREGLFPERLEHFSALEAKIVEITPSSTEKDSKPFHAVSLKTNVVEQHVYRTEQELRRASEIIKEHFNRLHNGGYQ